MHCIEGFVLSGRCAQRVFGELPDAHILPLLQGFAFVPFTDQLSDALGLGEPEWSEFWKLHRLAVSFIEKVTSSVNVGYVETDYFGGVGSQSAVLWSSGRVAFGPESAEFGPISNMLRKLGVQVGSCHDEFEAVGFDRHRSNEDWIEHAVGS